MDLRLGKLPARRSAVQLQLMTYLHRSMLPPVPAMFGHWRLVDRYGMLANDRAGDCVWAGAAHETMLWAAAARRPPVVFDDAAVLSDYAALTGYDPADPATDQGTDMELAARYRRKVGVVDTAGARHRIAAYLALDPGHLTQLYAAMFIFGAVGIGLTLPESALDQFDQGVGWSVVPGSPIAGGHYVSGVGRLTPLGDIAVITWGRMVVMEPGFYRRYCDEATVYLSEEFLDHAGRTPDGFALEQLRDDLAEVTRT